MTSTKTVAITGSNSGIGKAAALALSRRGHRVCMLVRESEKSRSAVDEVQAASPTREICPFFVDLASQASVRSVAAQMGQRLDRLDVLVNNAAVFKRRRQESPDGHEMTLAVNYLAPFLLTNLLLPLLGDGDGARIVNVTSALHTRGRADLREILATERYDGRQAYADSKHLLVLFTLTLADRLVPEHITVNCVHPGLAATGVFREYAAVVRSVLNLFLAAPGRAAHPLVTLAVSDEWADTTGRYFNGTLPEAIPDGSTGPVVLDQLWRRTAELTGLDVH